jgi:hypothetical protein
MIERGKHQPVNVAERQSLRGFAPQHIELMSKDKDLSSNAARGRNTPIKAYKINLQRSLIGSISRFAGAVSRFEFAVGTRGRVRPVR